jgi:phage-related tail fiber protein
MATKVHNSQIEVGTDFDINSKKLTSVADGTASGDAINKGQLDAAVAGLRDPKDACRMASTGNLTLSGLQTVDGIAGNADDRVLAKDQTTGADRGSYLMKSGAWIRTPDADSNAEVTQGMSFYIAEGTVNGAKTFVLTTPDPIVLGTTALTFAQTGGSTSTIVEGEVPSGSINGVNAAFTIANSPVAGSVKVYLRGLRMRGGGVDYTLSDTTITFVTAPTTGSEILVDYRY